MWVDEVLATGTRKAGFKLELTINVILLRNQNLADLGHVKSTKTMQLTPTGTLLSLKPGLRYNLTFIFGQFFK